MKRVGTVNPRLDRSVRCTCGWKGKFSELVSPNSIELKHVECPKCKWEDWEFCLSSDEKSEMRELKKSVKEDT